MRQRLSIVGKGFVYGVCVAALLPFASADAQGPSVAMQPLPAPVAAAPAPATTTSPSPAAPSAIKPVAPPSMEEREDPFSPSPTDAERRAEEDRRVRELVQPMINQMRDAISQGMGAQIEQSMQKSLETMKRPDGTVPGAGVGGPGGSVKGGGDHGASSAEQQKEEEAEARSQEQYAKALALAEDPNPAKRSLGRALLEQYGRGIMPRWSSASGVYFIGCVNKKRMYRDKFGDVFSSEFWFDGSAGAGNSTGGTGVTQTTAARQPQQRVASGASSGQGSALALDPCAD